MLRQLYAHGLHGFMLSADSDFHVFWICKYSYYIGIASQEVNYRFIPLGGIKIRIIRPNRASVYYLVIRCGSNF